MDDTTRYLLTVRRLRNMGEALERMANEARNVLVDATDDQATALEQWAAKALHHCDAMSQTGNGDGWWCCDVCGEPVERQGPLPAPLDPPGPCGSPPPPLYRGCLPCNRPAGHLGPHAHPHPGRT